jgi:hypothetical protein
MGLKPYDLVWIEGRSAAWRYPSEIAELKNFAPIVEEQPYDRFFKKSTETHSVEEIFTEKINIDKEKKSFQQEQKKKEIIAEPVKKIQPRPQEYFRDYQPKEEFHPQPSRQVFVSLPKTNKRVETKNEVQKLEASYSSYPVYSNPEPEPVLERKYSQTLDDIKEMYVNTLVQRKNRNRRKEFAKKLIRPVFYSMLLIASGVVIGYFVLNRKFSLEAGQLSVNVPPQSRNNDQSKLSVFQPDKSNDNRLQDNRNQASNNQTQSTQKLPVKNPQVLSTTDPNTENVNGTDALNQSAPLVEKKDVEIDPQSGERNKVIRDSENINSGNDAKDDKSGGSSEDGKELRRLVSVDANDYLRGVFGGIRNLELTVRNRSKFSLDAVTVQLQYLKNNNQPIKTETITFKNVNANGVATVRIPDSQRGMKVSYRITNMESRDF